jgi:hypothetical protein
MSAPVLYSRLDKEGRPCDQNPSKSMNLSSGGVRLESSFSLDSGEMLDISIALGEDLVTFRGKVAHITASENQGFELGISIEEIDDDSRTALTRFVIYRWQKEGV